MVERKLVDGKRRFSVTLTPPFIEVLDSLVEKGIYINHQAAIRESLRRLFKVSG